jgi:ribosomal-protein-alanine N-acetyltransferase
MVIETERLVLRRWEARDRAPYAALTADPEVMAWLGGVLDVQRSGEHIDRMDGHFDDWGHGRYALERKADGVFLGYTGIQRIWPGLPVAGAEIGWRLIRSAWGHGYASEAARAATKEGLNRFGLREVLAFTAEANVRSRAVMDRAGFTRDPSRDFDHPQLPEGDPLRRHLVFFAALD